MNHSGWSRTTTTAISERQASATSPSVIGFILFAVTNELFVNIYPRVRNVSFLPACGIYTAILHTLTENANSTLCVVSSHKWGTTKWVGWRSNPRLRVFSSMLHRLSYRPAFCLCFGLASRPKSGTKTNTARCLFGGTPGCEGFTRKPAEDVTRAILDSANQSQTAH
ncbi:MAG: hypothetical protein JWM11_4551 [Planctomycetaceae bacterium]|nr:hypothetical protein [Planctomycetaceae bacterium]